jgi:hypothetical protein
VKDSELAKFVSENKSMDFEISIVKKLNRGPNDMFSYGCGWHDGLRRGMELAKKIYRPDLVESEESEVPNNEHGDFLEDRYDR